jgi:hypothetical protein
MSDIKQNGMSIGEVLAAVNKSRNLKTFPSFPGSKINSLILN